MASTHTPPVPGTGIRKIGDSVHRKEDDRYIQGQGAYSDDINKSGQLYAVFVRSAHAHGTLNGIDVAEASQAPGVVAVLTGQDYVDDGMGPVVHRAIEGSPVDFRQPNFGGDDPVALQFNQWPLPLDVVRHIGEPVAIVIAETQAEAEDAAGLVVPDITPLKAVVDVDQAAAPDAPTINKDAPGNVCVHHFNGDHDAVAMALAASHTVVQGRFDVSRITGAQMEPRACVAEFDEKEKRYIVTAGNQGVHRYRDMIASALKAEPEDVRVVCPDVGGGFGPRGHSNPEFPVIAWAARKMGRPVKWANTRIESFVSDWQGRDMLLDGEMGFDQHGRMTTYKLKLRANNGAHTICYAPTANASKLVTTVYDIQNASLELIAYLTNTLPVLPYRAAGRPEIHYTIERLVDMGAAALGVDRVDLRKRNLIPMDAMPYKSVMGLNYDVCAFEDALDKAADQCDWTGFDARRTEAEGRGKLRGISVVPFIESPVGSPVEAGRVEIDSMGRTVIFAGTQVHGQGHETTYAQVISDLLGIPFEDITLAQGDTQELPKGGGTHSDRSMRIMGTLLHQMSMEIIDEARPVAAILLQTDADNLVYEDRAFRVKDDDSGQEVTIPDVAAALPEFPDLQGEYAAEHGVSLGASADHLGRINAFPYGASSAEVEIDPETGELTIWSFSIVDDCGVAVNPMIVHGQVHGGIVQGVGQAIGEAMIYDPDSGQALTGSFMDYMMPRADQFPHFEVDSIHVPIDGNPLGVRAGGEAGTVPALAVIGNAVLHALSPLGINHIDMPYTAANIWAAIQETKGSA